MDIKLTVNVLSLIVKVRDLYLTPLITWKQVVSGVFLFVKGEVLTQKREAYMIKIHF